MYSGTGAFTEENRLFDFRVRLLTAVLLTAVAFVWGWVLLDLLFGATPSPELSIVFVAVNLLGLLGVWARRFLREDAHVQGVALVVVLALVGVSLYVGTQAQDLLLASTLAVTLLMGAFTLPRIPYWALTAVAIGLLGARILSIAYPAFEADGSVPQAEILPLLYILAALAFFGYVIRYAGTTLTRVVERGERNSDLLLAAAELGQSLSRLASMDNPFDRIVERVKQRMGYYHVQIFMLDEESRYAELKASTGEAGRQLLARKHRLAIGSQSVIGRVTQVGEPIVARDTDRDPLHARNELLPDTRAELALPIMEGDSVIGALDVQSTQSKVFGAGDVRVLQVIANEIGMIHTNARLEQSRAQTMEENKRLFLESEANMREVQRLNRQLTQRAWQDYLRSPDTVSGITVQAEEDEVQEAASWTPYMVEASQRRRPVNTMTDDGRVVAVPIVLRGEVIGAIEANVGESSQYDEDTIELMQSIAQRLAISLDNARLFTEAQQSTQQEQRLNEIVTQYQSANTVDDLLRITLSELTDTLGAESGMIRLGVPQATNGGNGGGNSDDMGQSNGSGEQPL